MESISVAPARVTTLPSPPLERKPSPSPPSPAISDRDKSDSPSEYASKMSEDRQSQGSPSTVASPTASPKRGKDEQTPSVDDYEKGLVLCGTCGEGVPFRDPQSGGFTLRLWDTHRDQCRSQHDPQPEPIVFTPETTVDTMANPPLKKRRAKRTEEERIEYLRTDPYVAQFEPYRVLCGSCNKWIRLRPNSTYCSIPWDAHRKSCLSKKAFSNARIAGAVDGRTTILNGDPDVRMFDAERVQCIRCDHWIPVSSDGGHYALQAWYAHRDECRLRSPPNRLSFRHVLPVENRAIEPARSGPAAAPHTTSPNGYFSPGSGAHSSANRQATLQPSLGSKSSPMLSTKSRAPAPSLGPLPSPQIFSHASAGSPYATPLSMGSSYASGPDGSPPMSLRDLGPGGLAAHDARRKNAEQRAAALRADPLLREVEPNRVFCGLCGKWVQLRQDSSFCAYPWHQHRGKCLARYQRRQEKAHNYAHAAAQNGSYDARYRDGPYSTHGASHLGGDLDAEGSFDEELDSEEERALLRRHSLDEDSDDGDSITSHPYPHVQAHAHAHKQRYEKYSGHPYARPPPPLQSYPFSSVHASSGGRYKLGPVTSVTGPSAYGKYNPQYALRRAPSVEDINDVSMDEDADGEADVDMDDEDDGSGREHSGRYKVSHRSTREYSQSRVRHQSRRRVELPPILADLRSASGRLSFISDSVQHLFRTTYERGDELSVGALVNYLNAAMPADKHDDFDVQEVTRAAASLTKSGVLVQEGDRLRPRE